MLLFISPLVFGGLGAVAWSIWVVGVLSVLLAASVLLGGGFERRTLVGQR